MLLIKTAFQRKLLDKYYYMKLHELLGENFAGAFASVPMALGGGDPKASIYDKSKKSKKKDKKTEQTKHIMIKR